MALIFAARQTSAGSSTVVFTPRLDARPDVAAVRLLCFTHRHSSNNTV
jgi:hypothetical protein